MLGVKQPWAVAARLRRHGKTNSVTGGLGVIPPGEWGNLFFLQSTVLRKSCTAITSQVIAQPQGMFSGLTKDSNTISRNAQSVFGWPEV